MTIERGSLLINRYRIIDILGQGGMGSIYQAEDENLGVDVAVKENLFTSEEYARQFRREAVILANLRHPNLPRVTDHFVIDGQGQYLVMDFIEGEDLRERIDRQGFVSDSEAVIIGIAICEALAYLHSRRPQIVHRDIKPGNVKITSTGNIILVDFGLAKLTQGSQMTSTGARAMTPGYSPPEQYGAARTDQRSDIYSLGATLYMALTGALPEDALARAMGQTDLTRIQNYNPKASRRLTTVIEKALELRPEDRFQSAEEFQHALIGTRLITKNKRELELVHAPAPGGAGIANGEAAGSHSYNSRLAKEFGSDFNSGHIGSPSLPADTGSLSGRSRYRSSGCWLTGAFILGLLIIMISIAYLTQPLLFNQIADLIPQNQILAPLTSWIITPTEAIPPPTSTPQQSSPTAVALVETSDIQSSSPTPTATAPQITNSPTAEPEVFPVPSGTFTPSPTPMGGGAGQVAYASDITGIPQIWLMNADGTAARQITDIPDGACQPAWSPGGEQLAFISPCGGNQETYPGAAIWIIDVDGTDPFALPSVPGGDFDPNWSPDGEKIIFTSLRDFNRAQVYEFNLVDESVRSLSANTVRDSQPVYSPDGKQIAFVTTRRGPYQIWIMDDEGGEANLLSRSGSLKDSHPDWSPDSQAIMFTQNELLGGVPRLVAMRVEEGNLIENRVVRESIPMREAAYSLDGAWIVFESWPEGTNHDIFIMTHNGLGRQRLTSDQALDFDPAWRP
jgi:serine/threonine protein kinase